ncbi:hypothetical protein HX049_08040 [Myroides odoratimimus]|uniref:hypothetical protein n=1 Tax=Myroides odoratimimus TaxID=76832 RepID=UPI0025767C21|nr:hypothetical protein [Myroides odoratimimus]MDM1397124.1 hypothetical protein [Myroides odoratimimus]
MKTEELIKIILDNWSQVTVVIGAIGFLLKTIFDRKSKQIEIRTTVFYERKFNQIEKINKALIDFSKPINHLINLMTNGCQLSAGFTITTSKISNSHFELVTELETLKLYLSKYSKEEIDKYIQIVKKIYMTSISINTKYNENTDNLINESHLRNELQKDYILLLKEFDVFFDKNYKLYS